MTDINELAIEAMMDDLEKINIESADMISDFRRVIKRTNQSDYIVRAATMHSLSILMAEYFCDQSDTVDMAPDVAQAHWAGILTNMLGLVTEHYAGKAN
jgi:vacuolar-type H+-ATPase catalytic subunit A/Vma1